ncbi:unnamed protein product [Nezara viridula]|uniref:Uncharacterized protein n=1 Tax=Nezara viridula TaxID=85310 RepID=A0A9P0E6P2_NEZVI|nr:unnamed protein product [Nezara viridula]
MMSSEGDKKTPSGWRVKVRNVIKVVSNNRKPFKIRPEAHSIKSPKFHISNWTSSESDNEKSDTGEVMMLEVAETKFGIKPLRKKFRDQKLLIYTLPNENNSLCKVPVENLVKLSEEKLKLESQNLNGNQNDFIEATKISTIATAYADDKTTKIETTIADPSETGDKITNQAKSIAHPDGKDGPVANSLHHRPEPGKEEGSHSLSLFSSPLPKEEAPAKGMYFGPHPINLQLDVN